MIDASRVWLYMDATITDRVDAPWALCAAVGIVALLLGFRSHVRQATRKHCNQQYTVALGTEGQGPGGADSSWVF